MFHDILQPRSVTRDQNFWTFEWSFQVFATVLKIHPEIRNSCENFTAFSKSSKDIILCEMLHIRTILGFLMAVAKLIIK